MPKRVQTSGNEDSPPAKIPKPTSICEYCNKTFTSRGLSLHQRKCSKKLAHEKNVAKKTRIYKFCILNEYIHEEILSFLSNQTLTKMQMITGDHYDVCEPELAKICCTCENDNFTVSSFRCQQCIHWSSYRPRTTKRMAKAIYGLEDNDLLALPHNFEGSNCLYERSDLMDLISRTCGSKKELLRHLVKVRAQWEKAEAEKWRRKKICRFLVNRALELVRLVKTGHYKELKIEDKGQWYPRLYDIKKACQDGGLNLLSVLESTLCKDFIENEIESVEAVMNGIQHD